MTENTHQDLEQEIQSNDQSVKDKVEKQEEEQQLKNEETVAAEEKVEAAEEKQEVSETEKLSAELAEYKDKYLRIYSDFENFRRRTAKEKLELVSTANAGLLTDLLPVIDDFERALGAMEGKEEAKGLQEGVELVRNKFEKTLEQKGLKQMEIAKGDDFNPDFHEAITQIPVEDKKLKGKIVDVIEKGYFLGEKVIRFAKVVTGA
ncbi:nucleotide exchange factor GrpE [Xanthovirga aplysinae]|uniref:nucleotide exchange factor GrpE n=1 Tax=Xanthovirga aplysinae TaxID=2529853 RepID=UPI0012BC1CD3|nr:nucleotide exchange factor GrpE [Xanthovirga aplysinae]MTI32006.1 nucleotide exchange factor GrpE [Xanthovirga aplysinae]